MSARYSSPGTLWSPVDQADWASGRMAEVGLSNRAGTLRVRLNRIGVGPGVSSARAWRLTPPPPAP